MKYFTSDWHLGDDRIGINGKPNLFYRPFSSVAEQDREIFNRIDFSGIEAGDTLYHLGDVFYNEGDFQMHIMENIKKRLKSVKMILIEGNYDVGKTDLLSNFFDDIKDSDNVEIGGNTFYLNHYPVNCIGSEPSLTGHIHGLWKVQKGMINVGVDAWHFMPVSEETILFCWNAMQNHYDENVFIK